MSEARSAYPLPSVTVDIAAWAVLETDLKLLLIRRKGPPFQEAWALPGGFVRVSGGVDDLGEDLWEAADRELAEETGLGRGRVELEQVHTFGASGRDPRTRVITVAHWCAVPPELAAYARAGSDASQTRWASYANIDDVELAFDHREIATAAHRALLEAHDEGRVERLLTPTPFSISELKAVHEALFRRKLDTPNFRRRFLAQVEAGEAELAEGERITGKRRAKVYRWLAPEG